MRSMTEAPTLQGPGRAKTQLSPNGWAGQALRGARLVSTSSRRGRDDRSSPSRGCPVNAVWFSVRRYQFPGALWMWRTCPADLGLTDGAVTDVKTVKE
jgi:hypothetical protein